MKYALLILLGSLWAARLSAIKWAGLSGIPAFVTVTLAIFGVAIVLILMAIARRTWPPLSRATLVFYVLSGSFGFVLPFFLEAVIAPHLPVFVFIVIIATMPLLTQILAVAVGLERPNLTQVAVVIAGFAISGLVIWDSTGAADGAATSLRWAGFAFFVPAVYALNTVFIAKRWPKGVDAGSVALGQAIVVALAALFGSVVTGVTSDWSLALVNPWAIALISVLEAAAIVVYLKITNTYGASFVAFANYVSIAIAAPLGAILFGNDIGVVALAGGGMLIALLIVKDRASKSG